MSSFAYWDSIRKLNIELGPPEVRIARAKARKLSQREGPDDFSVRVDRWIESGELTGKALDVVPMAAQIHRRNFK